jgi:acyl-coenzyme A thioesterase PaaI-like protein
MSVAPGKQTDSLLRDQLSNVATVSFFTLVQQPWTATVDEEASFLYAGLTLENTKVNCTYLRPAPEGAKVFVDSRVVHLGYVLVQT